jgi:preprotein translocase subunit SecD
MKRSLWVSLIGSLVVSFGGLALVLSLGWAPALGLDLQGGASVVLRPTEGSSTEGLGQAVEIIRNRVDGFGIAESEVIRQGDAIVVNLPGVKNQDDALRLVGQTAQLEFRPVLASFLPSQVDTSGTTTSTPGTTAAGASTTVAGASTTVAGATTVPPATTTATTAVATTGAPNPGDSRGVASAATTTAPTTAPPTTAAGATTVAPTTTAPTTSTTVGQTELPTCANASEFDQPDQTVILPECQRQDVVAYYQVGPVFLSGTAVSSAEALYNTQTGEWTVDVGLKGGSGGMDTFNEWAAKCYNGQPECPSSGASRGRIAIVLDGQVKSAPQVNSPNFDGKVTISGNFTEREAKDLEQLLKYGALPVELKAEAVQTVSPTLGQDSLRAAVIAGFVGVALVLALMILYYRRLAVVVIVGVAASGALIWTVVSIWGETRGLALTLAGIAGLIVSVGITVDSYVVYFERLKDDVRAGRSIRTSAERGFKSAWRTILAANVVSLIGAVLLWWLTVGSVRGFAFFLGISTAVDMVIAYFFTRPAVILLARSRFIEGSKVLGVTRGEAAELATQGAR